MVMTSESEDANVVYVFVENDEREGAASAGDSDATAAISAEDLSNWLSIVGPLEYVKLQYDATSQRPCFCVRFRRSAAAKQAFEYLDGVRLKNCPVRIQSRVFRRTVADVADPHALQRAEDSAPTPATATESELGQRPSAGLPHNHCLPQMLRMDPELVEFLAEKGTSPSHEQGEQTFPCFSDCASELRAKQAELHSILSAIAATRASIISVDNEIRRVATAAGATEGQTQPSRATKADASLWPEQQSRESDAPCAVRSAAAIPLSRCPPAALVSYVSEMFGPLSWCQCLLDTTGGEDQYCVAFAFMLCHDSEAFMRSFTQDGEGTERKSKVPRRESTAEDEVRRAAAESALRLANWIAF